MAIKLDEGGAVLRRTKYTGPCILEIKAREELERGVVKRCIELELDWTEGVQSAGEVTLGLRHTMIYGIASGSGSYWGKVFVPLTRCIYYKWR